MSKPTQAQIREINRSLLATVRADWQFPDERPARQNLHHQSSQEPVTYRERYYSTSDDDGTEADGETSEGSDEEEDDGVEETSAESSGVKVTKKGKKKEKHNFYSPDSVAEYLERKIQARKRRKRKVLEEEMAVNPGLCFFLRRRNAWTGALSQESVRKRESTKDTFIPTASTPPGESIEAEEMVAATATVSVADEASQENTEGSLSSPPTQAQHPGPKAQSPFEPPEDLATVTNLLVPIVSPFLPEGHPVRSSIMARSHSELYEKVVRDSRTPAVPINLAHMMQVIVQGWKDEGNWPPRGAGMSELAIAVRRKGTVLRPLRKLHAPGEQHGGIFANHKHLQKGVDSVKRVLRLSGSAAPPGD